MTTSPTSALLVSIDQAGDLLGVRRSTVNRLVYSGSLPSLVIGRRRLIAVDDLTQFIQMRRTAPGALGREASETTRTSSGKLDALDDNGGSTSAPPAA